MTRSGSIAFATLGLLVVGVACSWLYGRRAPQEALHETAAQSTSPAAKLRAPDPSASAEPTPVDLANFGAEVAFLTQEAEALELRTTGERVVRRRVPAPDEQSAELEASGRGYVRLSDPGQFLEWTAPAEGNALVLRFSLPDAPRGGGRTARLRLLVNGELRRVLELNSVHSYLYSENQERNGQSDQPPHRPHTFWDEDRWLLSKQWTKGDILRWELPEEEQGWVSIDLVDLEMVAPPVSQPPSALSVTDCGAIPNDAQLDTAAIERCMDRARREKRSIWLPAGRFLHDRRFELEGLEVRGAGMWYTILEGVSLPARAFGGQFGFRLSGRGASVRDLTIQARDTNRKDGSIAFVGKGEDWEVERVWMRWVNAGLWAGGRRGKVLSCRVRSTYADGLNINNGNDHRAEDILVANNHVRGTGDDGIAILSHEKSPHLSRNVTLRHNTVIAPWWGHNLDVAGGIGHRIVGNYLADSALSGALVINLPPSYPMHAQGSVLVEHNAIVRGGGNLSGQRRGAIWVYAGSQDVGQVVLRDNTIVAPWFSALSVHGPRAVALTFSNNRILGAGVPVVEVNDTSGCALLLEHNEVTPSGDLHGQRSSGGQKDAVRIGSKCKVSFTDNHW